MTDKPRYRVNRDEIPLRSIVPEAFHPDAKKQGVRLETRKCYGSDTSIMFADRAPGYHTTPHQHDCEQFNIIMSGEIWFFVEDRGYRCRAGDVMRIPRDKVHWAWNRGTEVASLIESHTPPLTGDANALEKAVGLLGPDDDPSAIRHMANITVPYDPAEMTAIEQRAIAEVEGEDSAG